MKKNWTELVVILDRGGSMQGLKGDNTGGMENASRPSFCHQVIVESLSGKYATLGLSGQYRTLTVLPTTAGTPVVISIRLFVVDAMGIKPNFIVLIGLITRFSLMV